MFCSECDKMTSRVLARPAIWPAAADWERLGEILCQWCGRILPGPDPVATARATFSGLTRFGLTDDGRPILDVPMGHPASTPQTEA